MACTSFVGTPASLRAPAATRSARARVSVRADASSAATCVVTPATVGSRSGSASVKGTVRKQNEDRFASYVRPPPPLFRETPMGLRARGRRDGRRRAATTTDPAAPRFDDPRLDVTSSLARIDRRARALFVFVSPIRRTRGLSLVFSPRAHH